MKPVAEALAESESVPPRTWGLLPVSWRRAVFSLLVVTSIIGLAGLMVITLSPGGYDLFDLVLIACFLVTLPWTVTGFWNALIGFVIMRTSPDPTYRACPNWPSCEENSPVTDRTAILMCVRNEDADKVARHLNLMMEGLVNSGASHLFHAYVLSDSSGDDSTKREDLVFKRLQNRWQGIFPVTYRRRIDNAGYKAGNIRDFCRRWGERHDYALVLDADSLMSAKSILRMVRIMQDHPRLGILQSLVVGMPTVSPFARVFQFGMRLGMRSYTLGSAWWQADCGPYWGHNAVIRLKPFMQHCELPMLPGGPPLGGQILSHDQVEAVLMRRAGYEVRVLLEEGGSWEENPPTLLEYIRRDLRWCHGNMQYWRLLTAPGLKPVSRIQLLLAIFMYLGSPAWVAFVTVLALRAGLSTDAGQIFQPETGWVLFFCVMTMVFAPKLATVADVLASSRTRRAFGGSASVALSTVSEIVFSMILAPVLALAHTRFLLGLPFGRAAIWSAQRRSTHRVPVREALRRLWPETLFGASMVAWLLFTAPVALVGFLPFVLGPLLSVTIAMVTSWAALGLFLSRRMGLWRIPDETAPAGELEALRLPALRWSRKALATSKLALGAASSD